MALTVSSDNKSDIWTLDLVRETLTRLTFNEASSSPLWTRDGKRIAFMLGDYLQFKTAVYWKAADGTGGDEKLMPEQDGNDFFPSSLSGDGKTLLLQEVKSGFTQSAIDTLPLEGDRKLRTLLKEKYWEDNPKISQDGRWIAYDSMESGKSEVYVRPFPDVNKGKWQVSTNGGSIPLWSPNGKELFYRNGDSVMAVAVQTEPTFNPGKAETLFKGQYGDFDWDINPDGKRFLITKEAGTTASGGGGPRKINIVLNWIDELKQRVPVK